MSGCEALVAGAATGVAPALRAVDCLTAETAATSFSRLFGANGALLPALTVLLTLYVGLFAIGLLTGRTRLGVAALTPRMMTLGLVLTFATSWLAWQGVAWNLATGAPDELASVLMGTRGSATEVFAQRLDIVFAAVAEVATGQQGGTAPQPGGLFSPQTLVWLAAMLLMLGTVGVLVTARIVAAVLLAVGPVFVVLALFSGTRGLFAGWLRGLVLTAAAPLLAVLAGGLTLEFSVPVVASMREAGAVDARAAMALFLIGSVHIALMAMVLRVTGAIVAGWQVFGLAPPPRGEAGAAAGRASPSMAASTLLAAATGAAADRGSGRALGAAAVTLAVPAGALPDGAPVAAGERPRHTQVTTFTGQPGFQPSSPRHRARGVGSRFRAPQPGRRELSR